MVRPRKRALMNTLFMLLCIAVTVLHLRRGDTLGLVLHRDTLANRALLPLIAHFFVHTDWPRLLAHLAGIVLYGTLLEKYLGAKRYLLYLLGNMVLINIFFLTHPYFRGVSSLSGSSSVLYGMATVVMVVWMLRARGQHRQNLAATRIWVTLIILWIVNPLILYFTIGHVTGALLIHCASCLYGLLFSVVQYQYLRRSSGGIAV